MRKRFYVNPRVLIWFALALVPMSCAVWCLFYDRIIWLLK